MFLLLLGCSLFYLSSAGGCPLGYDSEDGKPKPGNLPTGAKNHLTKWVCHICETCVEAGFHIQKDHQNVPDDDITRVFEYACEQLDKDYFKEVTDVLINLCKGVAKEAGAEIFAKIKAGKQKEDICRTLKNPLCEPKSPITNEMVDAWINSAFKKEPELFNGPKGKRAIDPKDVEVASDLFAKKREEQEKDKPAFTWPSPKKPTGKKGKKAKGTKAPKEKKGEL